MPDTDRTPAAERSRRRSQLRDAIREELRAEFGDRIEDGLRCGCGECTRLRLQGFDRLADRILARYDRIEAQR